ncbi:MAG: hypothetical protein IJV24_07020 [Prevotella sp.]|nr:hypothetical protein [Prevotella sp.]
MGWTKQPVRTSEEIFSEIVGERPTWNGRVGDCSSPYEYWSDYLRDNYDLTLRQADEICRGLKEYYGIKHFYYGE